MSDARDMERRLRETADASIWAHEFLETWRKLHPGAPEPDEGWLIGWFANAMETAINHHERNRERARWMKAGLS